MEFDYFALVAKMFSQTDANKASDIFWHQFDYMK
jgi:hypothetical protein